MLVDARRARRRGPLALLSVLDLTLMIMVLKVLTQPMVLPTTPHLALILAMATVPGQWALLEAVVAPEKGTFLGTVLSLLVTQGDRKRLQNRLPGIRILRSMCTAMAALHFFTICACL